MCVDQSGSAQKKIRSNRRTREAKNPNTMNITFVRPTAGRRGDRGSRTRGRGRLLMRHTCRGNRR
eukprot:4556964-Pyramimonas_sp.AAC.1